MDERPEYCFVFHDSDVLRDILDPRQAVGERSHIGNAADGFHFAILLDNFCERNEVYGLADLLEFGHALINAAM